MRFESILTFYEIVRLVRIGLGIVIILSIAEIIRRRFYFSFGFNRKFVHILTGVLIFFAPVVFIRKNPILFISAFFVMINFVAYKRDWLVAIHGTARRSYGTVYYPLALFILTFLFWDKSSTLVVASMMPMVIGDAMAGIVGETLKKPHEYVMARDKKSFEGTCAMFLFSFASLVFTYWFYHLRVTDVNLRLEDTTLSVVALLCVSLFVTAWEAISSRGLDNLIVPLTTAFGLFFCFYPQSTGSAERFIMATILSIGISVASFRFKFLRASGAVAAFILALIIFSIGAWMWTVPILTFFLLSSLLSKIGAKKKLSANSIVEKDHVRDYMQVVANGGIPAVVALLYFFFFNLEWYIVYLASIAAVTADTWSTEIGMMSKRDPCNILNLKREQSGTSGAISIPGLAGGVLGTFIIALSSLPFLIPMITYRDVIISIVVIVVAAGCIGNIADSVLGASIQGEYLCANCNQRTEKKIHCGHQTGLVRGLHWLNNDVVNMLCAAVGCAVAIGFYHLVLR